MADRDLVAGQQGPDGASPKPARSLAMTHRRAGSRCIACYLRCCACALASVICAFGLFICFVVWLFVDVWVFGFAWLFVFVRALLRLRVASLRNSGTQITGPKDLQGRET